jgi:hypothetical protein
MWVVVSVVVLVVAIATYVTWTATRVDRLHARAAAASAALEAQSMRRAAAAIELGESERVSEALDAAKAVLGASSEDRPAAENRLTRELRLAATKFVPDDLNGVVEASRRLALARQVHSDLVRDALAVRRRRLVRMLGMTRGHAEPTFFDIDDPTLDTLR